MYKFLMKTNQSMIFSFMSNQAILVLVWKGQAMKIDCFMKDQEFEFTDQFLGSIIESLFFHLKKNRATD